MSEWGGETLTLKSIPFLSAASPRAMARVRGATRLVSYPEGATIFREGDLPTHLCVIKAGTVEILDVGLDGSEDVLRTLGRGQMLGELGILGGHARSATARAAEDCEIWEIEREAFIETYENEPGVSLEIAHVMASYLLDAEAIAEDLLFLDLRGRLAKRLLTLIDVLGSDVRRVVATGERSEEEIKAVLRKAGETGHFGDQEFGQLDRLAMLAGGTRRDVAEILTEMQENGLLVVAEGHIVLLDEEAIAASARPS